MPQSNETVTLKLPSGESVDAIVPAGSSDAQVKALMQQKHPEFFKQSVAPTQMEQQLNKEAEPWRKVSTSAGLLSQAKDVPGAIWQGLKNIPQGLAGMADALTNPMGAA